MRVHDAEPSRLVGAEPESRCQKHLLLQQRVHGQGIHVSSARLWMVRQILGAQVQPEEEAGVGEDLVWMYEVSTLCMSVFSATPSDR